MSGWRLLGVAAIPLLPAIVASRSRPSALAEGSTTASRRIAESSELLLIAFTPFVATLTLTFAQYEPLLWPILLWLAVLLAATRFTVRPLLRVATRAQLQRDLVVAAMEAERARLAADLHDDALQDLTLLVRRLDAAGDEEGAAQARAIADRLREICGDLRLPILDDLGVGPALDWLVLRIERLAGGEVRLERSEAARPPADIELAVFRVAQEALANAVKHGQPPIVVRYQSTPTGVSLSIDDAGPGIAADAARAGRRPVATSGCSTCSSGPRPSGPSSTSGAGRRAAPTSPSSGGPGDAHPGGHRRRPPGRAPRARRRCSAAAAGPGRRRLAADRSRRPAPPASTGPRPPTSCSSTSGSATTAGCAS